MKKFITCLAFVLMAGTVDASNCEYSRKIERTVEIGSASNLEVQAGAGALAIVGESGRNNVLIAAELCSSDESWLTEMDVSSEVRGKTASFLTNMPKRSYLQNEDQHATIDLTLTVPSKVMLQVEDSSGEALVRNVESLDMKDSSGELKIIKVSGDVTVIDSSGKLSLSEIGGDVEITDSSGAIDVKDVQGSVVVLADSSGRIEAKRIGKDFLVERDSSGGIDVKDIGGDFTVVRDSSGGIEHKRVMGKISLPE